MLPRQRRGRVRMKPTDAPRVSPSLPVYLPSASPHASHPFCEQKQSLVGPFHLTRSGCFLRSEHDSVTGGPPKIYARIGAQTMLSAMERGVRFAYAVGNEQAEPGRGRAETYTLASVPACESEVRCRR